MTYTPGDAEPFDLDALLGNRRWRRANVATRVGLPSRLVANGGAVTQAQPWQTHKVMEHCADLSLLLGNTIPSTGDNLTAPTCTYRAAIAIGGSPIPVFGPNGSRDIVVETGALVETVPVFGYVPAGSIIVVRDRRTYASAPANWPTGPLLNYNDSFNEIGSALTDKTLTGSLTSRTINGWGLAPPVAVLGRTRAQRTWAFVTDSIGDGANDPAATTATADYGFLQKGMTAAGKPWLAMGIANYQMGHLMGSTAQRAWRLQAAVRAGVTDLILELAVNDFAPGVNRTAAAVFAFMVQLGTECAAAGIRLHVCTCLPRTNPDNSYPRTTGGNDAAGTPDAIVALNALIRAGNAAFAGVIDTTAGMVDPVEPRRWIAGVHAEGIHPSGTGHSIMSGIVQAYVGAFG